MEVMSTCLDKLLTSRQKSRPPDQVGLPEGIISQIALSVVRALDYLKEKHVRFFEIKFGCFSIISLKSCGFIVNLFDD